MRIPVATSLLLVVFAAAATPRTVESQGFKDRLKKKASEAVKGKDDKSGKKDDSKQQSDNSRTSPWPKECPPLTPEKVRDFLRGLETEANVRQSFDDMAVSLKTAVEYSACRDKELSGPAYQKIMMQGFTGNATPSAAQVKKQMEKNGAEAEVYIEHKCGKDPSKYNKADVYAKAEKDGAKAAGLDDKCYQEMKERAYAFCLLPPAAQEAAKQNGIKVDVIGVTEDWVYTADEAKAVAAKCPELIKAIDGLNAQSPEYAKVRPSIRP
jgi:hypothetical protein